VSVIEEERTMESTPTDKRIDDLSSRVGRFEGRFERFEDKVDARFERLESKVDTTNRTIWAGIFAAALIKILFG
jgi:hypothetical protein